MDFLSSPLLPSHTSLSTSHGSTTRSSISLRVFDFDFFLLGGKGSGPIYLGVFRRSFVNIVSPFDFLSPIRARGLRPYHGPGLEIGFR